MNISFGQRFIYYTHDPDDPENLISEDFDLEDIDINETLEEVGPQTLLDDTEDTEIEDNENTTDDLIQDDIVDEDISDILEESREFWEPKKDS